MVTQRIILTILVPFFSFLLGVKNKFKSKSDRYALWIFSGFIGLNLAITRVGLDINRYIDSFMSYKEKGVKDYIEFLTGYFNFENYHFDIFTETLNFVLSRFSSEPMFLCLVFGLIFGWFYSKTIHSIGCNSRPFDIFDWLLFVLILVVIFPTQGINQFRFYTASFLFVFACLMDIVWSKQSHKYKVLMLAAPLIHIGTSLLVLVYIIHKLTHKLGTWVSISLIVGLTIGGLALTDILDPVLNGMGGSIGNKYDDYTGQAANIRMESFKSRIWYAAYWREIALINLSFLNILLYLMADFKAAGWQKELFRLNLIFISFSIVLTDFYMNFRYYEVVILFLLIQSFFIYNSRSFHNFKKAKRFALIATPGLLLVLSLKIAAILQLQKVYLPVSNYFLAWFYTDNESIWSFIGL